MKKLIAAAALAVAFALGGAGVAHADAPAPYTLTAWQLGAGSTVVNPWVTAQTKVAEVGVSDETLSQLDHSPLLTCGHIYQIDIYTQPTEGTTLTGPSAPNAEHFPSDDNAHWRYITTDPCPLPTVVLPDAVSYCDSYTLPALPTGAKYALPAGDIVEADRPHAGTFPLAVGQTVAAVTEHTISGYAPASKVLGPWTGVACPSLTIAEPTSKCNSVTFPVQPEGANYINVRPNTYGAGTYPLTVGQKVEVGIIYSKPHFTTVEKNWTFVGVKCPGKPKLAFTGTSAADKREQAQTGTLGLGLLGGGLALVGFTLYRRFRESD